ncbi:MAG: antitoxin [Actinobacteria bacterium]|nr:antitoxin [Actinomycetota bacterium]
MADVLIRDLSPELIDALESRASSLGISRVELMRRALSREVLIKSESVTEQHLSALLELLPDLLDDEIMRGAWR